ncbi:hypothetical protein [Streptococcus sp. B01]|nr:hypothetical protein [Streptococcus sp. B01]MCQ9211809.1 hypothetical protein [Streptococcus sp. B01]MCQ9212840.1 hypothetical protein [Streptococcus sp. B01]MCQ9212929.1 hypothetical protein [Streptococcus sp. O1]MCQ9215005.1 hypothetical protein [Streptococcus sp. O1]
MKNLLGSLITGVALIKKGKINMRKFTHTFKKEDQIVKSWVALVVGAIYSFDDVPKLFNLRTVVSQVLTEKGVEIEK